jgi:hypothetical protein
MRAGSAGWWSIAGGAGYGAGPMILGADAVDDDNLQPREDRGATVLPALVGLVGDLFQRLDAGNAGHVVSAGVGDAVEPVQIASADGFAECVAFGAVMLQDVRLPKREAERRIRKARLFGGVPALEAFPNHEIQGGAQLAGDGAALGRRRRNVPKVTFSDRAAAP